MLFKVFDDIIDYIKFNEYKLIQMSKFLISLSEH